MRQWLTQLWYRKSAAAWLLAPLSWLYAAVIAVRTRAYARGWLASERAGKPVIVVGNLTVGGTGKTPLVLWLARRLTELGFAVGIVSRGYGASGGAGPRFVEVTDSWQSVGDEPLLLKRRTGCLTVVSPDRVAGARALAARGVDVIICDDGLQHLHLARDCEIVVIDAARGFGNGWLLPAGPLREPAGRIRRADLIVLTTAGAAAGPAAFSPADLPAFAMSFAALDAQRLDGLEPPRPLERFAGERVHAVAGIGHPERFFEDLRARGLDVVPHAFADHHAFEPAELDFPDGAPIMTEKDAMRCQGFATARMWYLPVKARFVERDSHALLDRVCRSIALPSPGATR